MEYFHRAYSLENRGHFAIDSTEISDQTNDLKSLDQILSAMDRRINAADCQRFRDSIKPIKERLRKRRAEATANSISWFGSFDWKAIDSESERNKNIK